MGIALTKNSIDLGIITTNGEAMLKFYRDTLGLKYVREMKASGGNVMHQLACGDSLIKLVVAHSVPAEAPPGGMYGASGYRYWTIPVSNLAEMLKCCGDDGYKIAVKETEIRPGVKIAMVEDPDGNWVEFLEIKSTK